MSLGSHGALGALGCILRLPSTTCVFRGTRPHLSKVQFSSSVKWGFTLQGEGISTEQMKHLTSAGYRGRWGSAALRDSPCLYEGNWEDQAKSCSPGSPACRVGHKTGLLSGCRLHARSGCLSFLTRKSGSTAHMLGQGWQGCQNPKYSDIAPAGTGKRPPWENVYLTSTSCKISFSRDWLVVTLVYLFIYFLF